VCQFEAVEPWLHLVYILSETVRELAFLSHPMTVEEHNRIEVLALAHLNLPETKRKPKKLSQTYIAEQTGLKRSTVSRIINQENMTKVLYRKGPESTIDAEKMIREVHDDVVLRKKSNRELADHFQISKRYLQKILNKAGLNSYSRRKKPFVSEVNRIKRMKFAMYHAEWTVDDRNRVIWTDETYIYLS
jgi:DNA-binding Xre family transcriptional regulator